MAKKRSGSDEPREEPEIASQKHAEDFFKSLRSEFRERPITKSDRKRLRKFLAKHSKEELRSVMRRAMINLLQHPVPPRRPRDEK